MKETSGLFTHITTLASYGVARGLVAILTISNAHCWFGGGGASHFTLRHIYLRGISEPKHIILLTGTIQKVLSIIYNLYIIYGFQRLFIIMIGNNVNIPLVNGASPSIFSDTFSIKRVGTVAQWQSS